MFLEKYTRHLDKYAPFRKLSKKENKLKQKPWLTKGLLKSISKKRSLFKKFKNLKVKDKNSSDVYKLYKRYNDTINKLKKKCKRDFYQNYFNENYKNSKKVWIGINKLLNRQRNQRGTIYLEEFLAL